MALCRCGSTAAAGTAGCSAFHEGGRPGPTLVLLSGRRLDIDRRGLETTESVRRRAGARFDLPPKYVRLVRRSGAEIKDPEPPSTWLADEVTVVLADQPVEARRFEGGPLHAAARGGQLGLCRALLAQRADVNEGQDCADWRCGSPESSTGTPIEQVRSAAVAKELLRHRADLGGSFPERPLHLAVDQADQELMELMVAFGADVNAWVRSFCSDAQHEEKTALHTSVMAGSVPLVRYLLGKRADVNARCWPDFLDTDPDTGRPVCPGFTALDLALRPLLGCGAEDLSEIRRILRDHGGAEHHREHGPCEGPIHDLPPLRD